MTQEEAYRLAVDTTLAHAAAIPYTGPAVGGDMYMDWPVHALAQLCPTGLAQSTFSSMLRSEIRKRSPYPLMAAGHMHSHGMAGAGGGGGAGSSGAVNVAESRRMHSLKDMMAMRMRWGFGENPIGFAHMAMHRAGDKVHIWVITHDGESVVLEDDAGLYPSDPLITKIRLMQGGDQK